MSSPSGDIFIEDYTEKSIIVYGPGTVEIKDMLRKFGKWKRLRRREVPKFAWIVPKKHKDKLIKLISEELGGPEPVTYSIDDVLECIDITAKNLGLSKKRVEDIVFGEYPQLRPTL